jgi:uncharacterized protein (TIGR00661 family)
LEKGSNFNNSGKKPRILIAPLDWGLGHATRCIPIIKELINEGCDVVIAADKKNSSLLKIEFPETVFLLLKGYQIHYSRKESFFLLQLVLQIPKIIFSVFKEKKWLKKNVEEYSIDAVISDNRFGMYHKKIPSIYITHQLHIKTGNAITEKFAEKIHSFFIKKYTTCWVPDKKINGLAGELSHPKKIPENVFYIGPLSRLHSIKNEELIYKLLISISGPEPQRTIFEDQILQELKTFSGRAFLIRGLPSEKDSLKDFNSIKIKNHLPANELNKIIGQSEIVISRSGYTTVMDLAVLKKKAILIPTPGQTEQEYLAKYLLEKQYFFSAQQKDFSIEKLIEAHKSFDFKSFNFPPEEYKKIIHEFVLSLKSVNFAPQ